MYDGQEMSYPQLQQAAAKAVETSGTTQAQVARELGVTRGAISRAVKEPGRTLASLQGRIIEQLTDFRIETETTIRVRKKT